jgi:hypothetical protein
MVMAGDHLISSQPIADPLSLMRSILHNPAIAGGIQDFVDSPGKNNPEFSYAKTISIILVSSLGSSKSDFAIQYHDWPWTHTPSQCSSLPSEGDGRVYAGTGEMA